MNQRQRFETAFNFTQPDRAPHFEQIFELEEEAFGLSFPTEEELNESTGDKRKRLFEKCAIIYSKIIERFKWDAIVVWRPASVYTDIRYEFIKFLKQYLGKDIPIGGFIWEAAISIDTVKDYMQFSIDLIENRKRLKDWASSMFTSSMEHARCLVDAGCDFVDIASDFAFNSGSFISPADFEELITPYVKNLISYVKSQGVKVILHSDGNLMPILGQIFEMSPHVLQSIDPMAGMDIAEVKKNTYGKIGLMGNVQCNLMQDGPIEKIKESAYYALEHGSKGGGYIFSTSNTIFKGVPLGNYDAMLSCLYDYYK